MNNVDLGEGELKKSLRTLIVLGLVAGSLLFGHSEKAHATEGLTAEVYNVYGQNGSPYIPQGMSPTLVTTVPNINLQWGGGSVLGGPAEDVIVRFTGSILSNTTQNISFLATADDGTRLYIDGVLVADDWVDKGGGGTTTDPISFTAGIPKTIELMYYENGGGANVFLYWNQSGSMQIIPAEAFTSQASLTIGAPRNLTVVDGETSTVLTWEAPDTGNTQPERYAISFSADGGGWGIATGNVGGPNSLNTTITISHSLLEGLKPSGTVWSFHIRSDNDTLALYSANSNVVTLKIGKTAEEIAAAAAAAQAIIDAENARLAAIAAEEEAIRLATVAAQAQAAAAAQAIINAQAAADQASAIAAQVAAQASAQQAEAARIQAEAAAIIAQQAAAAQAEANRLAALAAAQAEANKIAADLAAKLAAQAAEMAKEAARIQAEIDAKAEADRIAAEIEAAQAQMEAEAKAEADRIAQEEADAQEEANAQAEADRIAAEQEAMEQEIANALAEKEAAIAKEEAEIAEKLAEIAEAEAIEAEEEKAAEEELKEILEEAKDGKELTEEQKEILVEALIEDLKPGESISAEQVQASGVSYADLPPETPIEVRTDENGNALVITAEVAANIELVEDAGALVEAIFTDPGAALAAIGSIGADMTEEEREEATDMVVATVVATGAAINAAAVAAGGATGGSTSGGSSGGGGGANSPGSRGGRRW